LIGSGGEVGSCGSMVAAAMFRSAALSSRLTRLRTSLKRRHHHSGIAIPGAGARHVHGRAGICDFLLDDRVHADFSLPAVLALTVIGHFHEVGYGQDAQSNLAKLSLCPTPVVALTGLDELARVLFDNLQFVDNGMYWNSHFTGPFLNRTESNTHRSTTFPYRDYIFRFRTKAGLHGDTPANAPTMSRAANEGCRLVA
jgi:hypothetical protein